ncbi:MAG: CPBP family intramembrane metalloprotease [Cyclobacteriaceae bacterium]|nr:CPBP family intramembrane metalloprotease [Cyclobacteriaceae bacterium]
MSGLTGISQRNPLISVFFILCTVVIGFVVIGPIVGFFAALPFYGGTMLELTERITQGSIQHPELRVPVLIMQGFATLIGLILLPGLYLSALEHVSPVKWLNKKTPAIIAFTVTVIVIAFMVPNSVFIEWNSSFVFPEFLKEFGEWARAREDVAAELTKFFTVFNSTGDLLLGMVVIALLPALGEELVFRGMLQPELYRLSGNYHAAIWISAFIFSAFHMQFFGFVPRLFLGALFGYLYWWSGNFWVPVIAHFVNNGFMVIMLYLYQQEVITLDMDTPEAAPLSAIIPFTLVFAGALFYFYKFYKNQNITTE